MVNPVKCDGTVKNHDKRPVTAETGTPTSSKDCFYPPFGGRWPINNIFIV